MLRIHERVDSALILIKLPWLVLVDEGIGLIKQLILNAWFTYFDAERVPHGIQLHYDWSVVVLLLPNRLVILILILEFTRPHQNIKI